MLCICAPAYTPNPMPVSSIYYISLKYFFGGTPAVRTYAHTTYGAFRVFKQAQNEVQTNVSLATAKEQLCQRTRAMRLINVDDSAFGAPTRICPSKLP